MTPEQFKEYKELVEKTNARLKLLDDHLMHLFNSSNKISHFIGAERNNGILDKILRELEKN